MTQIFDSEKTLISFLKQYRPLAPAVPPELENQIISQIQQESRKIAQNNGQNTEQNPAQNSWRWQWAISGVLVAGVFMGWGSSQFRSAPQIAANSGENEAFLRENWSETTGRSNTLSSGTTTPVTTEWLTLAEPQTVFVGSRY